MCIIIFKRETYPIQLRTHFETGLDYYEIGSSECDLGMKCEMDFIVIIVIIIKCVQNPKFISHCPFSSANSSKIQTPKMYVRDIVCMFSIRNVNIGIVAISHLKFKLLHKLCDKNKINWLQSRQLCVILKMVCSTKNTSNDEPNIEQIVYTGNFDDRHYF